ncbi:sigma-70 family RNA polymerase sigma factor [Aquibacillus koreensis]|uniref:Sigma-70 family RNA polymerase sigma factor n=1 Tax=Aquibacillus koreensis TaxID=279446 RepID=A0A9X4AH63_9BACI|nr:sigma-70 family RNA polymerase sigma factor [Aquibacillus koreensis]MCT2536533.1 sigma-70 family RNA polymerase sigma factor [Aquibacillus koreensis]MDC3419379.1 sigma-70 family RNA polymerase sigma factor [Aquibacillus koreensis]
METKVNSSIFLASIDRYTSEQKINELYEEYKNKVYRLALSYVKDTYLAEDLAHEILVKCYLKRDKFHGDCSFHSWMNRVAINHCLDFLRKGYRHRDLLQEDLEIFHDEALTTPESEVLSNSERAELRCKLRQLPSKYEEVIILYYYKDMSLKEIELQLNIKLSTVKTRLFRAKKMLKEMF